MKRFSLVVLMLCWLCCWSLMPSILVGSSLAIAADQTELLDLNTHRRPTQSPAWDW